MRIIGPVGLAEHVAGVSGLNQPWISDYHFDLVELASDRYELPADSPCAGLVVQTVPTGHTENSICFRLSDETGRVLFYSGDTDYNEALIPLAEGADVAIVECSMPEEMKLPGHLTPLLAGRLAQRASVRRLVLTHFYEEVLSVDIPTRVGEEYSGTLDLGRKYASFPLRPGE